MPAWPAIFLDTCILEGEQFDFTSTQFKALLAAAKDKGIKLLLPQPTKDEIQRHIRNKIESAVTALKSVRKDHPVLSAMPGFPHSRVDREKIARDLSKTITSAWKNFQNHFALIDLDYSGIDIDEIMRWYDRGQSPFGLGGKSKEFPDAFAFAALRNYALNQKENVAIVSADNDFRKACAGISQLHFFPTLASLTNALLTEDGRFKAARELAESAIPLLTAKIKADFPDRGFDHELDPNGNGNVEDIKVNECEPTNIEVIGLGHEEFTIAFSAEVGFDAYVQYDDPDSWVNMGDGDIMYRHSCAGEVMETTVINCVARIRANADWTQVVEISAFKIEEEYIQVSEPAPQVDDRDYDDQ
jgi:hypothetical protein